MLAVSLLALVQLVSQTFDHGTLCGCIAGEPLCLDAQLRECGLCFEIGLKECACFRVPQALAILRDIAELDAPDCVEHKL